MAIITLPGLIDPHVHLRDPGQTEKEDFYTGTCAALAGGVTTVFDMPTKGFHMLTKEELNQKIKMAKQKAVCDWGVYFGTNGENIDLFENVISKTIGLKIYLTESTGHVLLSREQLPEIFKNWPKTKPIIVHIEGNLTDLALETALRFGNKTHITHVNSKELLGKIIEAKKDSKNITCDTTPHHLFLTTDDEKKLKKFGMMKPPLMSRKDVDYLWNNLSKIDCISTDHAPHTIEQKLSENAPTGVPGLETTLPLLLTAYSQKRISLDEIKRLTNTNVQKIFGFKQAKDTYVEIDPDEEYTIENENLFTKCGWSPFNGWKVKGKVKKVFIRGTKVFEDGKILTEPGFGRVIYPK